MNRNELTEAARRALDLAASVGGYVTAGTTVTGGRMHRVAASTLRSLSKRGLATLRLSNEGGLAAVLTDAGTSLARGCEGVRR